ncbi:MAG: iron-containing alcohol dehydrogenase [Oscillospiraceae bacterium]|nr:iron-containing alcohol dehydrogenase [Oscillospiraceae bacterium]
MILDTSKYLGKCVCGREHELRTKLVVCEYGALKNFDKYMADCGLTGFRTVIYDTNTYNLPSITHVPADQEIVLEAKGLHSEKGLIENMMTILERTPDYIVVVGGGTLMDFGRYSAWKLGIPFVAIPTIVSSDGFTADICSIIIDGQKKSIPMQAADAVICDMDVVSGAPMFLSIAGVQDIMAKYVSIADWKIAHLVSGEYFCPMVCDMAQEALDIMVRCANELAEGKEPDFEAMAYTQMLSGLTMQILSNSRAASGAEHLVAHLVEMKPRGFENAHGMHGECVGIGTIMCASAYHKLAERETIEVKPFEPVDEQWVRDVFGELADGILKENENDVLKTFAPENIKEKWPQIREIIATIPKAEELIELYTKIGAKHSLEELGIDESVREEFLDISSAIRNRLTLARMTRLIVK